MDRLKWCLKVKRGVKLVKPSDNLSRSYVKKAGDSLISMRLNLKEGIMDWAASAAYYARYQILYALFMKCGIKSEIHECTIETAKTIFGNLIHGARIRELEISKTQRIDLQYYTDRIVDRRELDRNMETAGDFVMEVKGIIDKMGPEVIEEARKRIRDLMHAS